MSERPFDLDSFPASQGSDSSSMSPFATLSTQSKGPIFSLRDHELQTHQTELDTANNIFTNDRNNLLNTPTLFNLDRKSQSLFLPESYHTPLFSRLNHTVAIQKISSYIARELHLNEELTEAIALGHDLGQPPFGYAGERTLDDLSLGGFHHTSQSLRVIDQLAERSGLNLSFEVRDGVSKHAYGNHKLQIEDSSVCPKTIEGDIVRFVDSFSYLNQDIEQVLQEGLSEFALDKNKHLKYLGETYNERRDTFTKDIIKNSYYQSKIKISDELYHHISALRKYFFEDIFRCSFVRKSENKMKSYVSITFLELLDNPEQVDILRKNTKNAFESNNFWQFCNIEKYETLLIDIIVKSSEKDLIDFCEQTIDSLPTYSIPS